MWKWFESEPPNHLVTSIDIFGEVQDFESQRVWRIKDGKYEYRAMFSSSTPSWKRVNHDVINGDAKARRKVWPEGMYIFVHKGWLTICWKSLIAFDDGVEEKEERATYWPAEFYEDDWEIIK